MQPFEGIRVLDLTHVLAGPFCTSQLANLGAEVIKIESPTHPDMTRDDGGSQTLNEDQMGTFFLSQSAGKKSLTLDLASKDGIAIFELLVKTSDVVVQNYSGDKLEKLGISFEKLSKINSKIIYCSMTGFGKTGPKANHPAYDVVIQAYSGIMAANGWSNEDPPLRVGPPMVDYGTGAQAAFAISSALFQRERTGTGQEIDVAMADAALMLMSSGVTETLATGVSPKRFGNSHPELPYYSAYKSSEGWVMLGAYTLKQASDLMNVLGYYGEALEIKNLTRKTIGSVSEQNRRLISKRIQENSAQYWEDILNESHVPAARIRRIDETLKEEQLLSRKVIQKYKKPFSNEAPEQLPVAAFSFSHGGPRLSGPSPQFGEHTEELLLDLGFSMNEISNLRKKGVCL
ncbi:MAG: CoA transferase [Proteobacteria bacterium]|jgi:crotonobetainyl-CoA:carnitine CoA-transferase CaiB-like acyl-CoA transferase|nr:CoA transferase [Pseudomonadota bacterium]